MSYYKITETEVFDPSAAAPTLFGSNFVTNYDFEFEPGAPLTELLDSVGITNLRYPGGSTTEQKFDMTNPESTVAVDGSGTQLTPMTQFFQTAAEIGADVTLVIPTRVGFAQSAGEALAAGADASSSGTYGSRYVLDANYWTDVANYVQYALDLAQQNGVTITTFELGNEFWGSGEMTASEYGVIAANLAIQLDRAFPGVDIIVQTVHSANLFSRKDASIVYVEPLANGEMQIRSQDYVDDYHGGVLPSGWLVRTMPPNGGYVDQIKAITKALNDLGAAHLIDGVIDHVYFRQGFDKVDTTREQVALTQNFDLFQAELGRTDLTRSVTEWSPSTVNERGLQYASMVVEGFFELVSNGIDAANFWPLTFGNPGIDNRVLIDSSQGDLTFGGTAFQMLAESVTWTTAQFDFEVSNDIDVHGFYHPAKQVIFASERSGADRHESAGQGITLDLENVLVDSWYFVAMTHLGETGDTGVAVHANPVITYSDGAMMFGHNVQFSLDAWGLQRIELTRITAGDDVIIGRGGNDTASGSYGNDVLAGYAGNDTLSGEGGNDKLYGGDGADYLSGGADADHLEGEAGDDVLVGGFWRDTLLGGDGNDTLTGDSGDDLLNGGNGDDTLNGSTSGDTLLGGSGNDTLRADLDPVEVSFDYFATTNTPFAGLWWAPRQKFAGDFDGDGRGDLLFLNGYDADPRAALQGGQTDGTLAYLPDAAGTNLFASAWWAPRDKFVGDFNGDGRDDMVFITGEDTSPRMTVLLGQSDGTLHYDPSRSFSTDLANSWWAARQKFAGDFNGDGRDDLIFFNADDSDPVAVVMQGQADGTLQLEPAAYTYTSFANSWWAAREKFVGDFNGDGRDDMIFLNADDANPGIAVLLGQSDGSLQVANGAHTQTPFANSWWAQREKFVGDFDGDGRDDLMLISGGDNGAHIQLLSGQADGSLLYMPEAFTLTPFASDWWTAREKFVTDVDGDGRDDIAFVSGLDTSPLIHVLATTSFNQTRLYGEAGDDTLIGGTEGDRIDGGTGADQLTGGAGSDVFAFRTGDGADVISDFEAGLDTIEFTGTGLTFADLTITADAAGAQLTYGAGDTITFAGLTVEDLSETDFIFI